MGQTLSEPVVEKVCSFPLISFANLIFLPFFLGLGITPHCNWSDAILHAVSKICCWAGITRVSEHFTPFYVLFSLIRFDLFGGENSNCLPSCHFFTRNSPSLRTPTRVLLFPPPPIPHSFFKKQENGAMRIGWPLYCYAVHFEINLKLLLTVGPV